MPVEFLYNRDNCSYFLRFDLSESGLRLSEIFCELGLIEHPLTTSFVIVRNPEIVNGQTGESVAFLQHGSVSPTCSA
jgi:hypothetical protein